MTAPNSETPNDSFKDEATIRPDASCNPCMSSGGLAPGMKVHGYTILSEVARGGMGIVFVAQHDKMERKVAIKTMLINAHAQSSDRHRFDIEAQAAAKLDHPGIVAIFEVGEYENDPYLVMEWIEGDNLATRLSRGPFSVEETVRVAIEVADAISHAHQRGVVHRDLKPANIILDRQQNERAILTDFGVAKCVEAIRVGLTTAGEPIGTPHYMPPEQADCSRGVVGPGSDIYSLGGVMYAMLAGHPPFQAPSSIDVIMQVLSNEPVALRKLNPALPAVLEAIVMKCLQKDLKRRYKTAAELSLDIQNFRDGKPTVARPLNAMRWVAYQIRHHVLFATVSGSGLLLLLVAFAGMTLAYTNALSSIMTLKQENLSLSDVLRNERVLFRSQLSQLHNREVPDAEFNLGRYASHAELASAKDPDLATRLSIETIKLADRESRPPPPFCVDWLRKYFSTLNETSLESLEGASPMELATAAELRLNKSLSADSKRAHEITVSGVATSSESIPAIERSPPLDQ